LRISTLIPMLFAVLLLACEPSIGDECETSSQCPSGSICDTSVKDGYCLGVSCDVDSDCPSASSCIFFDDYLSYCLADCQSDGDCRDGYRCRSDLGEKRFCWLPPGENDAPFSRAESAE
jgi:hypothetical protein